MARTWSYTKKKPDDMSAAQRARMGRPSSMTAFLVALVLVSVFFLGLTLYSAYQSMAHPLSQVYQPPADQPKDD
jgi:cytochrome c-type biogenesis protein CcmH/NrfG